MSRKLFLLSVITGLMIMILILPGCDALRASKVHGPPSAEQVDKRSRQDKDLDSR